MEKKLWNVDAVARKLGLASIRASNYKLEIARKERQKREKILKKRKTKTMIAKGCKDRREISLFSQE